MNTVKCERFRVVQTFAGSPEFLEQGTTVAADLYRDRLRGSCTHDCGRLLLWEKDWVYDLGYTLPQREFFGTGAAYLKWLATLPADVRGSSLQASRYGGLAHRGVSGILQALFVDCEHTSTRRPLRLL